MLHSLLAIFCDHFWAGFALGREGGQYLVQPFDPVGRKLNGPSNCVHQPPQDNFHCRQGAVALKELVEADRVLLPLPGIVVVVGLDGILCQCNRTARNGVIASVGTHLA